ncbi:LexA family transcriptional regulator [Bergeriella denitrificans]|uniref:Putative phage repressor n=1 Tax=Bergeriella denitrificans TaxID=494 RepID=A0A378UJR0_BERDE|nr:XRE family transcriptional regulator [Bergeriella denitrificans]STZ77360.1 putative phage repressor [Bergeriella denitrificans]
MTSKEVKYPEFAERLNKAKEKAGIELPELSKNTGISYEMVRRYTLGLAQPRTDGMERLAEVLNVSAPWLQFGESLMPQAGAIAIQEEVDTEHTHFEIQMYEYKLSAGTGNFVWVTNHKEDPLTFRERWFRARRLNPNTLRGMYVRGNSMEPDLKDWDTVIIDISDLDIADDEIYAVVFKDKFYIKRIRQTEDGLLLISSNPDYPPIEVTPESSHQFQLLGRMVWRGG